MIRYLDTSAALKLVVEEVESEALALELHESVRRGELIVSSWLLHTELHCVARRRGAFSPVNVQKLIERIALADVLREDFVRASTSEWGLRSADAIHLATAIRLGADEILAYDKELIDASNRVGIRAVAVEPRPGSGR